MEWNVSSEIHETCSGNLRIFKNLKQLINNNIFGPNNRKNKTKTGLNYDFTWSTLNEGKPRTKTG